MMKALIAAAVLASVVISPAQAWTNWQWRTWSYCAKVWAKTYWTTPECQRFFQGR